MTAGNSCSDPVELDALIERALIELQEDEWGDDPAILKLRNAANKSVLDAAINLCASSNSQERMLATLILAQFMRVESEANGRQRHIPVFVDERVTALLNLLQREQDPDVLMHIGTAFGHIKDPRAIVPLLPFKNHAHENVRFGVVFGLTGHEDERAINALIELSQDTDADVRDWATFGLGSILEVDTPEIREALLRNVGDPDEDTHIEALKGLLARRDQRIIAAMLDEIEIGKIEIGSEIAEQFYEMLKDLEEAKTNPRMKKVVEAYK